MSRTKKFSEDEFNQLNFVTESKARSTRKRVELNSKVLNDIVDSILTKYTRDLDDAIQSMDKCLENADTLDDKDIQRLVALIPSKIYWAGEALETLGIQSDTAGVMRTEAFNTAYTEAVGTVGDRNSVAFSEALNETFMEVAFQRAYKKLKLKIEHATMLNQSLKKLIEYRIAKINLSIGDKYSNRYNVED